MLYLNTKRTRIDAGLSGVDVLHAGCMHAAYVRLYDVVVDAGQSDVDNGLSGVHARIHLAASCQSI